MEGAIELPPRLAEAVERLVDDGWYSDPQSLVVEAVRRFIATHQPELMDRFIREDVEWGLRGQD
jgi:hypothetical protein